MTHVGVKDVHHKPAIIGEGGFDVAGVNSGDVEIWSQLSPELPDPYRADEFGYVVPGFEYHDELFYLDGRFYAVFAPSDVPVPGEVDEGDVLGTVFVYSWAVGELEWTFEFSEANFMGGGLFKTFGGFYDNAYWDAACDGTDIYVALTVTIVGAVACGPGHTVSVAYTEVRAFKGNRFGTWSYLGAVTSQSGTDHYSGDSEPLSFKMCASAADPGNCYIVASDGGDADPCNGGITAVEYFWVYGFGATAAFSVPVWLNQGTYSLSGSPPFPIAHVFNFDICNDGDDLQVIYRLREPAGSPNAGFDEPKIRVVKPASFTQTETFSGSADVLIVDSLLEVDTADAFTKLITPLWTENSGRKQRALIAKFADGGDIRGLDTDGITVRSLHDNTNLNSTALTDDAGLQASIDEAGPGEYYVPGIYYDSVGDEYWAIYRNSTSFRSSVTNDKCHDPEQWAGVPWHAPGFSGNLTTGQGALLDDAFYVLAVPVTDGDIHRPAVLRIPICRNCRRCSLSNASPPPEPEPLRVVVTGIPQVGETLTATIV